MAKKQSTRNGPSLWIFALFILIALVTVLALEYLEYRAGRPGILFPRLLQKKRAAPPPPSIQKELLALLDQAGCEYRFIRDKAGVRHFKVAVPVEGFPVLSARLRSLAAARGARLETSGDAQAEAGDLRLCQISWSGKTAYLLLITLEKPPPAAAPPPVEKKEPPAAPRLAIVIDDIGYTEIGAEQLRNLGIPVTAAVIPDAPFARTMAERVHRYGLEEIIHLPMQSKNSENHLASGGFIRPETTPEQIAEIIRLGLIRVPYARGLNNHMGSLVTSRPEWIGVVLEAAKKRELFFIDSRTSADSVAYDVARRLGMKTLFRDVFLDSTPAYDFTVGQIRLLVGLARKRGEALAIGHPFESTLAAIADTIEWIRSQRVSIVFASQLLD